MSLIADEKKSGTARGVRLALKGVDIEFGAFRAVSGADLDVAPGEFLCLLGPSGCGKSTLLSALAGFVTPASGSVEVDGAEPSAAGVSRGVVFQSTEVLFEWLTVRQNIAFGPRMRNLPKSRQRELVDEHLQLVGLKHAADKLPSQLSGGMRQRVQIARVLANEPRVVLMDEPFGALDAQTREVMQTELDRIWRARGCTVVFVTHDMDEAIVLSDRVAVMTAGPAAKIKSIYDIDLPRPRDVTSAEAVALRRQLHADISAEVTRSLVAQGVDEIESDPAVATERPA